jgi:glycine betaine/proline transport system permease protein
MNDTTFPSELATPDLGAQVMNAPALNTPAAPAFVDPWEAISAAPDTSATSAWLDAPANAARPARRPGRHRHPAASSCTRLSTARCRIAELDQRGPGLGGRALPPLLPDRAPADRQHAELGAATCSLAVPTLAMIALIGLLAWQFASRALAIGTTVALLLVAMLGIWPEAMVTLSLVLTSLVFCMVIGLPLGDLLASSDRAQRIMRPVLDAMQTTPAFVYLVPVVMLFGIGNVPGVIVTIIFALPPLVRLTNLGMRQVRPDLIEAARAYGASPWQMLTRVQLPLAMPSIMAGINQSLMLSLSMVVIASMIAVGGLGQMVLRGIGRLDMGLATVGGLGIVLLAITLDRLTQAMGQPRRSAGRRWWHTGPAGFVLRQLQRLVSPPSREGAQAVPALSTQAQ